MGLREETEDAHLKLQLRRQSSLNCLQVDFSLIHVSWIPLNSCHFSPPYPLDLSSMLSLKQDYYLVIFEQLLDKAELCTCPFTIPSVVKSCSFEI